MNTVVRKKPMNVLLVLIQILCIEKVLQHLLTGLFFVIEINGIGTPDIGTKIKIGDLEMAMLNLLFAVIFILGLFYIFKGKSIGTKIIVSMSIIDIVLEFIFHGFGFMTVSVLVSIIISIMIYYYLRRKAVAI